MHIQPIKYKIFIRKGELPPCDPQIVYMHIFWQKGDWNCAFMVPQNTHSLKKEKLPFCDHQKSYISVNLDQKGPEIMRI